MGNKRIEVAYYSKLGHTKAIAEEIAAELGLNAIDIGKAPELTGHVDLLFLGGAPYANIMDKKLREFALNLQDVDRVVLFSTSNWSRRTVKALRKILLEKGISVEKPYFYSHMFRVEKNKEKARKFARKYVE